MSQCRRFLPLALVLLMLCGITKPLGAQEPQAEARFINADGKEIGTAILTQTPSGVLIDITVNGVPAGEHGFHIHTTGTCDVPTFTSAGDHYNPTNARHGYLVAGGPHAGDMPNQFVREDGVLRAHVLNPYVTLRAGPTTLLDTDGSALMIHTRADDYKSHPAGEAGERFACAIIRPR